MVLILCFVALEGRRLGEVEPIVATGAINAASWKKHHSSVALSGRVSWASPRAKALGCSLGPFHGLGLASALKALPLTLL